VLPRGGQPGRSKLDITNSRDGLRFSVTANTIVSCRRLRGSASNSYVPARARSATTTATSDEFGVPLRTCAIQSRVFHPLTCAIPVKDTSALQVGRVTRNCLLPAMSSIVRCVRTSVSR